MLALPLVVGSLRAGLRWPQLWLAVAWTLGYLAFFTAGLYLRSGRKPRYRPPVVAYATSAAVVGGGLLAAHPELLRWGVVYLPLLLASLAFSARRAERHLLNDLLTVTAASLIAVVAFWLHDDDAWLPGSGSATAWVVAGGVFAYLLGTALYVKTMIRERGNVAMYRWSVGYHVAAALAFTPVAAVAVFLWLMAARAALVPRVWPRARPLQVGVGEIAASLALATVLLLAAPLR